MAIRVLGTRRYVLNMHTRMPFRYGIATLTALPHLFLQADVEIDGKVYAGLSAEHLPPKWFTKDPDSSARDDIDRILKVIDTACDVARGGGAGPQRLRVLEAGVRRAVGLGGRVGDPAAAGPLRHQPGRAGRVRRGLPGVGR